VAKRKTISNFESLYGFGENPRGMTAQTANGTAHPFGTGWNVTGSDWTMEQLPESPTRPGGRSTRTGE
jgi:hypothetical protein